MSKDPKAKVERKANAASSIAKAGVAKPSKVKRIALEWDALLSPDRLEGHDHKQRIYSSINDHRTPHERDYDRVVFCSAVRRLKDKTQVFPLESHDGVRTRLTHSMEVSNLARSMGTAIVSRSARLQSIPDASRNVPALLAAVALTHDLGNPPFGHQGEVAIRNWVEHKDAEIKYEAKRSYSRDLLKDFLLFEGNAQGFRILSRLQHQDHRSGMRLTASTLRAFMKYPWFSDSVKGSGGPKKFGVFQSERDVFEWASRKTELDGPARHPLSYLMEVCDDIAYSVLDIEDGVKKELISVAELASFLRSHSRYKQDARVIVLLEGYDRDLDWLNSLRMPESDNSQIPLSSKEIRDSQIDILRSCAIAYMVSDAVDRFVELEERNGFGELNKGIAEDFGCQELIKAFKEFAALRIYKHPSVLRAELQGHLIIPNLLDVFWAAVVRLQHGTHTKTDEYVISLMSPNYIRVYRQSVDLKLPVWYRQLQLVCDQVCGMTDSYALRVHADLIDLGVI